MANEPNTAPVDAGQQQAEERILTRSEVRGIYVTINAPSDADLFRALKASRHLCAQLAHQRQCEKSQCVFGICGNPGGVCLLSA